MGRVAGWLLVVVLTVAGCSGGIGADGGSCPGAVLAAGNAGPPIATSCIPAITYRGNHYLVLCQEVHRSRIGERFLFEGGETSFDGARHLLGFSDREAFLMEPDRCGERRMVAENVDDPSFELNTEDLRQPLGVTFRTDEDEVRPGAVVRLSLAAVDDFTWGMSARLGRLIGRGRPDQRSWRFVMELIGGHQGTLTINDREGEIPAIGFGGEGNWTWRVPRLRPGYYELRKPLSGPDLLGRSFASVRILILDEG